MILKDWIKELHERLPDYLASLNISGQPGRFQPAAAGLAPQGERVGLGFSCFAAKVNVTLNLWQTLSQDHQIQWLSHIKAYQRPSNPLRGRVMANAFIDRAVCRWHADRMPLLRKISQRVFPSRRLTYFEKVIIAETKQACATLAELGDEGLHSYRAFPHAENQISPYLNRLDWRQPWDAGAHFASLAVFIATQAPAFLSPAICQKLEAACQNYVETLVHPENGGYYLGPTPEYGMLVNGAMKVLTGLDWLNIPVHYPRQLIDTCLAKSPQPEGCHLVDAVYTLYRCAQLTTYRRKDIIRYGHQILKMIRAHYHPREGGFSYFPGKSQTQYYGIPITKGLDTADIHGTVLLVWAVAMTLDLLEENIYHWRVIKP